MLENKIKSLIDKFDTKNQIQYNKICNFGPVRLETVDNKYKPYLVSYTTDIPANTNIMNGKCKAVLFGPGSIEVAHSDHEHIDIDELIQSIQTYQDIALNLLRRCNIECKL